MHSYYLTTIQTVIALFTVLLVTGCSSGSDANDVLAQTDSVQSESINDNSAESLPTVSVGEGVLDDGLADDINLASPGQTPNETPADTAIDTPDEMPNDTATGAPGETPGQTPNTDDEEPVNNVPDPLVQNLTRIDFAITVPAYSSTTLQVRMTWGNKSIFAAWVGDEFWSVADDFPTNTENLLSVTFTEGNGNITLGRFETNFRTGTNASQSVQITADQFDSASWDNDGDNVSNLDELIAGTDPLESPRVLLFSETRDFRHNSTETAIVALEELAASAGMQTDRAADSNGIFTDTNLANYDAVVWVLTSGDVLNDDEQAAFERYIREGGGYAGIHAASFTEFEWPWYGRLVGAYFDSHPEIQVATQDVENRSHSSTAHLDTRWTRTERPILVHRRGTYSSQLRRA